MGRTNNPPYRNTLNNQGVFFHSSYGKIRENQNFRNRRCRYLSPYRQTSPLVESVSQQKKHTVWSETMTAGEPKKRKPGWLKRPTRFQRNIYLPLRAVQKLGLQRLWFYQLPDYNTTNESHEEFLDLDSMTTSCFFAPKNGTKRYHTYITPLIFVKTTQHSQWTKTIHPSYNLVGVLAAPTLKRNLASAMRIAPYFCTK